MYDIQKVREDFPILDREVYGKPLIYLDNGATTQKPRQVVEAITDEYYSVNANVHRGVHFLSQQATELHEASRETVRRFINARSSNEIVFTRGTTESTSQDSCGCRRFPWRSTVHQQSAAQSRGAGGAFSRPCGQQPR